MSFNLIHSNAHKTPQGQVGEGVLREARGEGALHGETA